MGDVPGRPPPVRAGSRAIAVLCLAVSQPFLVSSHIVRPDVVVAALVMLALYCALRGLQDGGRAWHLAAGALLGLSFDVHPNTLAFMPMVGLCYLLRFDGGRCWLVRAGCSRPGISLGAAYYVGVRILPDPGHYAEAFSYWIGVDKRPPSADGNILGALQAELGRWAQYFGRRIVELALLAIGVWAAVRRSFATRRLDPLLGGLLIALGVFVVLVSSKTEYYLILFFPMLVLLLASAIAELGAGLAAVPGGALVTGVRPLAGALLAVLAVSGLGFEDNFRDIVEAASDFRERDYGALSAQLQAQIPPGSVVVAPPVYWIGLARPPYYLEYVDFYVWERIRRERNVSWPEFLRQIDPEYVILDVKAKYDVTRSTPRFMEDNADLVAQIRHVHYTRVEVWKMRASGGQRGANTPSGPSGLREASR